MSKLHKLIRSEIERWREEGVVTGEQAEVLLQRYPAQETSTDWSRVVPTAAGAVIFGLGVILFFAYNWEDMHRYVKLGFIGLALLVAHGTALRFSRYGEHPGSRKGLSEGLHLVGTMLFGAGIWLVAQIYHIDEHYPNAYLVWSLAALSMAWVMPSLAQGLLALALVFMWGCFEIFDFYQAQHPANWLVAFGVIPLALRLRSNVLLFFALVIFVMLHVFSLINVDDDWVFSVLLMLASALLAGAKLLPTPADDLFQPAQILRRTGLAIWVVCVFIGTFAEIQIGALNDLPDDVLGWLYWGVPTALAIVTWGLALSVNRVPQSRAQLLETGAVLMVLLTVLASTFVGKEFNGVAWITFNLAFLMAGCVILSRGLSEVRWGLTALGTAMLASFVFARFMDLFDSLLARSAMFVLVGIALFLVGQLYSRRKQQLAQEPDHV